MDFKAKTSIIDSDFRASAIIHGLSNILLFSFSVSCTVVFATLAKKSNTFDGVNVMVMAIISGVITLISTGLLIYTLYKVLKVSEQRDRFKNSIQDYQEQNTGVDSNVRDEKLRELSRKYKSGNETKLSNLLEANQKIANPLLKSSRSRNLGFF